MSDEIQQIKNKIEVADLIGEYVQLKSAGVNKKGLCPFHNEKSPSFMVNAERGSWHCFGCGKGGDIFTFIEEMEGMEFKEALKYLAGRAGVVLTSYRSEVDSSQRNRIKDINTEAARFFYNFLCKISSAKPARDYLLQRGLKQETIDEWQIGYIPEQWDLLTQYLLKKGFGIDDLVASGFTIQRDKGHEINSGYATRSFWDRFRGRIMFPIWNVHGEVVGFTGRILIEKENSGGKYINTPQTLIYDKSRVIFGLNKAKQEIKAKDLIVMVEGQMDVIACHQAGMKNVVATSGTAFTDEQIKLLKRYSQNLNMSFDMDEAGQNAAKRGIAVAISLGMNVKVIRLPENAGKDPDECLKKNPAIWFQSVIQAQDVMQWYFDKVMSGKNLTDHKQKQLIVNKLLPEISLIPYAVERDHWLKELSQKLEVDTAVLRDDLARIKQQNIKIRQPIVTENKKTNIVLEKDRFNFLLERLFSLLLRFPNLVSILSDNSLEELLINSPYLGLYSGLKKGYTMEELNKTVVISNQENLVDLLAMQGEWEFSAISEVEGKKEAEQIFELIKQESFKKRRRELQVEIEQAEKAGDTVKVKLLMQEFGKL